MENPQFGQFPRLNFFFPLGFPKKIPGVFLKFLVLKKKKRTGPKKFFFLKNPEKKLRQKGGPEKI